MGHFEKIRNISVADQLTWQDKIFITIDVDWATDEVIGDVLDIIEKTDLPVTIFCTHKTKLMERMRENPNIELGIHVNFNYLLAGDFRYGCNAREVLEYYKKIVPDAVSIRAHSLTYNSNFLNLFLESGLENECSYCIPYNSNMILKPFYHWDRRIKRVPHFWEDDIQLMYDSRLNISDIHSYKGIKVFDFHPIHIFLNTEDMSRYESAKKDYHEHSKLLQYVNKEHYGVKDFFVDLIRSYK